MGWLDDVGAGLFGAANSLTFGALDPVTRWIGETVAGSDAVKRYDEWKKDKEAAIGIGDLAGTVGSLLLPGGLVVKGIGKGLGLAKGLATGAKMAKTADVLGKGVKGLDTVADIIRGTKVIGSAGGKMAKAGGMALRGALGAAEQAIPRAMMTAGPGDGKGWEDAAKAIAFGSVLGPVSGLISKGAGKLLGKATEGSLLKSVGINRAMLKEAATKGMPKSWRMGKANAIDDLTQRAVEDLRAAKIYGPKKLAARLEDPRFGGKDVFAEKAANYNAMPVAMRGKGIISGDEAKALIDQYGKIGSKAIGDLASEIKSMDWNQAKAYLQKVATAARTEGSGAASIVRGEAARVLSQNVDDIAELGMAPEMIEAARKAYPLRVVGELAKEKAAGSGGALFSAGSPTMEKLNMQKILGTVAGGAGGTMAGGFDINDPSTYAGGALGLVGGALGGQVLSRGLPRLANAIAGRLGGASTKAGTLVPKALGAMVGHGEDDAGGAAVPGGAASGTEAGVAKTEAALDASAPTPEAAAVAKGEASDEVNQAFADKIDDGARYMWGSMGFSAEVPFEEFKRILGEITANPETGKAFDPRKSARLLFPNKDERAEYLKQYDIVLQVKALGEGSLEKALTYEGATSPFLGGLKDIAAGAGFRDPEHMEKKQRFGMLAGILVNMATAGTTAQTRAYTQQETEDDIAEIARLEAPMEEKIRLLELQFQQEGLSNLPQFKQWGLM